MSHHSEPEIISHEHVKNSQSVETGKKLTLSSSISTFKGSSQLESGFPEPETVSSRGNFNKSLRSRKNMEPFK